MSVLRKIPEHLRVLFEKEALQICMRSVTREWELYEARLIAALTEWTVNGGQPNLIKVRQIQNDIAVGLSYPIEQCRIAEIEDHDYYCTKGRYDSYEYDCYEEEQLMCGTQWGMIRQNWRAEGEAGELRVQRDRDNMCMAVYESEHIPYDQQTKGQREITDMENAMFRGMEEFKKKLDQQVELKVSEVILAQEGISNADLMVKCQDQVMGENDQDQCGTNDQLIAGVYHGECHEKFVTDQAIDIRRPLIDVNNSRQRREGIRKKQTKINKIKGAFPRVFSQLTFVVLLGMCCVNVTQAGELDWTCNYQHRYTINSAYELGTLTIEYWSMWCYKYLNGEEWCVQTQYEKHRTYMCEVLDNEVCFEEIRPWYMYQVNYGEGYREPNIVMVYAVINREILVYQGAELGDVDINSEMVELADVAEMYHAACLNGEFYEPLFDRRLYYPMESLADDQRCSAEGSDGGGVIYAVIKGVVSWIVGYWRD